MCRVSQHISKNCPASFWFMCCIAILWMWLQWVYIKLYTAGVGVFSAYSDVSLLDPLLPLTHELYNEKVKPLGD